MPQLYRYSKALSQFVTFCDLDSRPCHDCKDLQCCTTFQTAYAAELLAVQQACVLLLQASIDFLGELRAAIARNGK